MPFSNRDRWQLIEKSIHHLRGRFCRRIAKPSGDYDGSIAGAAEPDGAQVLAESADEPDRGCSSECCQVVVVDLVMKRGVTSLVQPRELIEADGAAIREHKSVECNGQPRLSH